MEIIQEELRRVHSIGSPSSFFLGVSIVHTDQEDCALLVEVELDSGGQLLLLGGQVLCEHWRQTDGALRDGGVSFHAPPESGITADL